MIQFAKAKNEDDGAGAEEPRNYGTEEPGSYGAEKQWSVNVVMEKQRTVVKKLSIFVGNFCELIGSDRSRADSIN